MKQSDGKEGHLKPVVLLKLAEKPGGTVVQVTRFAQEVGRLRPAVSRLLSKLISDGLVEEREGRWFLTEKGFTAINVPIPIFDNEYWALYDALTDEERGWYLKSDVVEQHHNEYVSELKSLDLKASTQSDLEHVTDNRLITYREARQMVEQAKQEVMNQVLEHFRKLFGQA